MNLKDKIIVITGSSQGIGKALAKALKDHGAHVIISSNDETKLTATAKELSLDSFPADVTTNTDLEKLADYVVQKYSRIDFWINNAGIQIAPSPQEAVDLKKLHKLFDINFFGYFYGCQVALKQMKKQNAGVIININSTAGLSGKPNLAAYAASKFAIKGLTESIRRELEGSRIQVFAVFPGGVQTDIYHEKYPQDFHDYMPVEMVIEKIIENLESEEPEIDLVIKRPGK